MSVKKKKSRSFTWILFHKFAQLPGSWCKGSWGDDAIDRISIFSATYLLLISVTCEQLWIIEVSKSTPLLSGKAYFENQNYMTTSDGLVGVWSGWWELSWCPEPVALGGPCWRAPQWPSIWASSLGESWDCYLFLLGLHAKCHLLFDPIWDLTEQGHAFLSEKARLATCTRGLVSAAADLSSLRRWFLETILLLRALPFCLDSVWYPCLIFPKIREVCSQLKTKENNHKS